MTLEAAMQLALQHHRAGRLAQAEQLYRAILSQSADEPDPLHLLGVIAYQAGRMTEGESLIRRAIAIRPTVAAYYGNLGTLLKDRGEVDEAIGAYRKAIELAPDVAIGHYNLAIALAAQGKSDDAIESFRRAIRLDPRYAPAYVGLGVELKNNECLDEAIDAYRRAIELQPDSAEALSNLGAALISKWKLDDALAACRRAIELKPTMAEAHNNLGNVLKSLGKGNEAIASFSRAIALKPKLAAAHQNIGETLKHMGKFDEAAAAFRDAIAADPRHMEVYYSYGTVLHEQRKLDEALACFDRAIALRADHSGVHSNRVYAIHFHPGFDAESIAREHRLWNDRHGQPLEKFILPHTNDPNPNRRVRIGYVSPNFRTHPVSRFLLPLLAHHNRSQFEIFAYADVRHPDGMTDRLRSLVDHWRDTVPLSDNQMAEVIRADQIDILVDLNMHMGNDRLKVFARKPAPVQVTYLAYCSTTGLDAIDYRISDPWLDPPGMDERIYSEKTVRLPTCYWCYEPGIETPPVAPLPALSNGYITFGCLNNFAKISEEALSAWCGVMSQVPGSRLILHAKEGTHRQELLNFVAARGIEPQRIQFVGYLPGLEYFRMYQQIDIALDPFPYAGGTTTCDALWMGVPVVTLAGQTAVARAGVSILSNAGMSTWIARTTSEYAALAVETSRNLPSLAALREKLRDQLKTSPLMNARQFTTEVEQVFRTLWKTWCAEITPPPIVEPETK